MGDEDRDDERLELETEHRSFLDYHITAKRKRLTLDGQQARLSFELLSGHLYSFWAGGGDVAGSQYP